MLFFTIFATMLSTYHYKLKQMSMKKMNYLSVLLIALMIMTFTSCDKDGVYNPKKKISRIFTSSGSSKQLVQTWTWDKNLLTKIDFGDNDFYRFEYEGKRLSKILSSNGRSTINYFYDGSKYDKVEESYKYSVEESYYSYSVSSLTTYKFTYDGSKISKITINYTSTSTYDYHFGFKGDVPKHTFEQKLNPLQFILSEQTCKKIAQIKSAKEENKDSETYTSTYTIALTWDGNNVSKEVYEEIDEGELYTFTYAYTYDKEKNPYFGLFIDDGYLMTDSFSKNNVVKITGTSNDGEYGEMEYTYRYEDGFPIERMLIEDGYTYTTYYEYE